MKDLSEEIGVTTGTLTVTVDRLEEKNILVRKPHEKDRRAFLIALTRDGEAYLEQHHKLHIRMTQEIVADLIPEE